MTSLTIYTTTLTFLAGIGILESVISERLLRTIWKPPPPLLLTIAKLVPQLWAPEMPYQNEEQVNNGKGSKKKKRKKTSSGYLFSSTSMASHHLSVGDSPSDRRPASFEKQQCSPRGRPEQPLGNKNLAKSSSSSSSFEYYCKGEEELEIEDNQVRLVDSNNNTVRFQIQRLAATNIARDIRHLRLLSGESWAIIANRIDILIFLIIFPITTFLPCVIFVPLMVVDYKSCQ